MCSLRSQRLHSTSKRPNGGTGTASGSRLSKSLSGRRRGWKFLIDALTRFDLEQLRLPLEKSVAVKIIHNAAFDATRLSKHYDFNLPSVFDTMRAARRSGEQGSFTQRLAVTLLGQTCFHFLFARFLLLIRIVFYVYLFRMESM